MEALNKFGRKPDVATFYKQYLEEAGFVDVVQEKFIWPTNRWPKDKKLKEIGSCSFSSPKMALIESRYVATRESWRWS